MRRVGVEILSEGLEDVAFGRASRQIEAKCVPYFGFTLFGCLTCLCDLEMVFFILA